MAFEAEVPLFNLEIPAGGTVEFVVDIAGGPETLVGYTGAMQIREKRTDEALIAEVPGSAIVVNAVTRQVTVRIPSSETSAYDFRLGVYDLIIIGPTGDAWRVVEGQARLSLAVTRGA